MTKNVFLFITLFLFFSFAATKHSNIPVASDPSTWTLPQLKNYLDSNSIKYSSFPERSDYVRLVEEQAVAKKEALADWFNKNKDQAATSLETVQDMVTGLVSRLRDELKARKGITDAEIDTIVKAVRGEVVKVNDWANLKEAQTEEIYTNVKNDLEKDSKLKKNDLDWSLGVLKTELESTVKDYSASARFFATTASISGASAYHYVTSKVADAYSSAASVVGQALHKSSSDASSSASSATSAAAGGASAIYSSASSAASSVYDAASESLSSAYDAATETVSGAYDTTTESIDSVLSAVRARLVSSKDCTEDQVNGIVAYIKDNIFLTRLQTEHQVNTFIDNMKLYLVEKKQASKDQVENMTKSVKEELEKWRKTMPWAKKEEL